MKVINIQDEFYTMVHEKIKAGMRDQLKKLCTKHVHTNDNYAMVNGMLVASEFTVPEEGNDLIVVIINQGLLIFSLKDKTQEQWFEAVKVLTKKEIATPRKVLAKMIGLRMVKIRDYYNKEVISRQRDQYTSKKSLPDLPELDSKKAIEDFNRVFCLAMGGHFSSDWFRELEDLFKRPDVDDELVHEAWCLVVAREIMES